MGARAGGARGATSLFLAVAAILAGCTAPDAGGPTPGGVADGGAPTTTGPDATTTDRDATPPAADATTPATPRRPDATATAGPVIAPGAPRRAADLPLPRTEVAGTAWDGRIAVAGGLDTSGAASARLDLYDPAGDGWTRAPDLPRALHHTVLVVLGGRLYVVGGYANTPGGWAPQDAVHSLGPGEDAWRPEAPLGTPRGALAVAPHGDGLIAVGGVGPGGVLTSTEVLSDGGWEPGPPLQEPREHLAATAAGGAVYAIAGRAGGLGTSLTSVEVLRGGQWEPASALNAARSGIGAAAIGTVPCVAGGEVPSGTVAEVECLVEGVWEVVGRLDVPRHGLAVVALDGALHVIGGGPQPGLTVSGAHEVLPLR